MSLTLDAHSRARSSSSTFRALSPPNRFSLDYVIFLGWTTLFSTSLPRAEELPRRRRQREDDGRTGELQL